MELWLLLFVLLVLLSVSFLLIVILVAFRKRHNRVNIEAKPIIEDPITLKQVPCPCISDPADKYISLIVPAFNEENRLPTALEEIMLYLQNRIAKDKTFSYEVIIVDDGSVDGTKRVAFDFVRKYSVDNVRVIPLGKNNGKGEAIRKGMLHSRGELLLMLDADGATQIDDLEKLENKDSRAILELDLMSDILVSETFILLIYKILADAKEELEHGDVALADSVSRISDIPVVVFGSRAHLEEKALATRKWYRNFLMKGFHLVVILTAGPGVRDTQCGFKMFSRAAGRKIFTNIRLKRWCFDVEIVYLCKRLGIPVKEISVRWVEIAGSKVSILSIGNMLWELLLMSIAYRSGIWQLFHLSYT